MPNITPEVGEPIEGRCTKCRKNTGHIIVTLAEESPALVRCTACDRQHQYRPPTKAKKTTRRPAVDPREAERQEWQSLRPGMDDTRATVYSMAAPYKVRSLVSHPVFGLGLVQRVIGSRKMEVLFEDGRKTMRCK